ncbi:MAG: DUF4864 domain-containing protein [Halobacteriales archaeon]
MTERDPIDRDAFEALLADLSHAELIRFVKSLWTEAGRSVDQSGAVLEVTHASSETTFRRVLVADASVEGIGDVDLTPIDAIVSVYPSRTQVEFEANDIDIIDAEDLYSEALYAIDTETTNAIFRSFFDRPIRVPERSDPSTLPSPAETETGAGWEFRSNDTAEATEPDQASGSAVQTGPTDSKRGDRSWRRAMLGGFVVLGLFVVGLGLGVVPGSGPSAPIDGPMQSVAVPDTDRAVGDEGPFRVPDRETENDRQSPTAYSSETSMSPTVTATTVEVTVTPTPAVVSQPVQQPRFAKLRPTCDRPPRLVVAIQIGALRTNNATTNDGIYTTWQFASPRNKEITGPYSNFVDIVTGETYAPLLNHARVTYNPIEISDGLATQPLVVTDANGTQHGYEWVLVKQQGPQYEGCWMTDGVRPVNASRVLGTS